MEKLIITAAICGAEVTKEQNPSVPYTIEEIGNEAYSAYKAGASIIHLHVREDDGKSTQDKGRFRDCIREIKSKCEDVIIQPSTGGALGMSNRERLAPVYLDPEMATLDCGTCNFGFNEVFVNTIETIIEFSNEMVSRNIKPELECFDKGMIDTVLNLNKQGIIQSPMHFNLVLGVPGTLNANPQNLMFLVNNLPKKSTFTITGIGKSQFNMATMAILLGGHVRVGFEDNNYLSKGHLAKNNGELVEKVVRIARELGRDVATPEESREILNINSKNKNN